MSKYSEITEMQRFEELLTPYIQGHLDDEARREVEEYAESSSGFAELLNFEKQIAASVKSTSAAPVDVVPSFRQLKQRIGSQAKPDAGVKLFFERVGEFLSSRNGGLVTASLALLAVSLLTVMRPGVDTSAGDFTTLSDGGSEISPIPGRQYFRVVFIDDIGPSDVARLATELQFTVETGPNRFGAYTVSLDASAAAAQSLANNWREDGRFVFVEATRVAETP